MFGRKTRKALNDLSVRTLRWRLEESAVIKENLDAILKMGERVTKIEEDLKKMMENIQLLNEFQEPNCKMSVLSAEDAAKMKEDVMKLVEESATAKAKTAVPVQCKMALVKKGEKKPKIKKPSVARQIVDYLARVGTGIWVITADVKESILGEDAISAGGGHFSRSIKRLAALKLIEEESTSSPDLPSIRLTELGMAQHSLCWFTLKDYEKVA